MKDLLSEANRIKGLMRKCKTEAELEAVADQERANVQAMNRAGGEAKTLAIQIVNLKAFLLQGIEK